MQVLRILVLVIFIVYSNGQVEIEKGRCNNKVLAEIMKKSMTSNIEQSRDSIAEMAQKQIGGSFGVICSHDDIAAAIMPTEIFCEATTSDYVTCFAFKRG